VTDVAYLCPNCGSVHEVESIRENLILDLRPAASYELSGQHGKLAPRRRFLRWRLTRGLALAIWPGYSRHPRLAWGRRLLQEPSAPVSDYPVACWAAGSGSDARAGNPATAVPVADGPVAASTLAPRSPAETMISQSEAASMHAAARSPSSGDKRRSRASDHSSAGLNQ
jgi:hypothetical protein